MKGLVLGCVVLALVLGAGCEQLQQRAPEVYWVMIDASPNIFEPAVFHNGVAIGDIQATDISPVLVTRLAVTIAPEYQELMTTKTVFIVSAGRLTIDELGPLGAPVAPGAVLLGFPSPLSLKWFKTRTVFSRSADVAAETAKALFATMDNGGQMRAAAGH
ncbi:MAG: hypothetical protein ABIL58_10770 [Pseudomonadota bacterium]